MNIDQYFSDHYDEILQVAKNIYGKTNIDPHDVITELYIDMTNPNRRLPSEEREVIYWIMRTLKSWTWYKGGNPLKKLEIKDGLQYDKYFVDAVIHDSESSETSKDLHSAGFTDDETDKILQCIEVSKDMPLYYKRIFVLYYIDGLTMEEIGSSCDLPKSTIFGEVKKVQHFIKEVLELNPQKTLFKL